MSNNIYLAVHPQDKNFEDIENINISQIISFKEDSNGFNTKANIINFGWTTLNISFDKFKELVEYHR